MLTTLAAVSMLAVAPTGDDPAALLPETTLAYFGTDSVRASSQASGSSAMAKIMGEAEVRAFLEKPMGAAENVLQQMMEMARSQADASMPDNVDVDVDVDVSMYDLTEPSEAPIGRLFVALTHFDMQTASGMPDVGLVIGAELLEPDHLAGLRSMWGSIPGESQTGNHAGHEFFSKTLEQGLSVNMTFLDDLAVMSLSDRALHGVIERFADDSAPSLATTAGYRALLEQSGGLPTGGSTTFMRTQPLLGIGKMGVQMMAAQQGMEDHIGDIMQLIDGLGLDAVTWTGSVSHRGADGFVHGTLVSHFDDAATGLIPGLLAAARPIDLKRLERIPGNTGTLSGSATGGLGAIYDYGMKAARTFAPEEFDAQMAEFQELLGDVDLRNDLLANIDGDIWSHTLPGLGMMGASADVRTIEMKDPQRFVAALDKLVSVINTRFGEQLGGGEIRFERSVHEDHDFYELDLSRTPGGAMTMMNPSMAIKDGALWMSMQSGTALRSALNDEVGETTILDNAEFVAFLDELKRTGGSDELASVTYVDVEQTFGEAYQQVGGILAMMGGSSGDIPVDFALLPSSSTITKHLGQTFSASTMPNDAGLQVMRTRALFEMGDFLPIAFAAALIGAGQEMGIEPAPQAAREVPPTEIVQEDISQLRAGVTVYKISVGSAPESLDDLVKPLPDYPNGCLGQAELPRDPWGNAYNYSVDGRRWNVWSSGPNGIDEGGEGDDISRKR